MSSEGSQSRQRDKLVLEQGVERQRDLGGSGKFVPGWIVEGDLTCEPPVIRRYYLSQFVLSEIELSMGKSPDQTSVSP